MKKIYIIVLFFLYFSKVVIAQNSNLQSHWNFIFENKRTKALKTLKQEFKTEEDLLTYQILRAESGLLKVPENFYKQFFELENAEFYLYAFWLDSFFFDDYFNSGFHKENIKVINNINISSIKESSIKTSLLYLKAVAARYQNNWEDYFKFNNNIVSIRDWQYCGVFENLNESGLDIYYEPEDKAVSVEDFNANSNGFVNWYTPIHNKDEAYQGYVNHQEFGEGVHYAQTFIINTQEQDIYMRIGNASAFKVWLNDVLLLENVEDVATDLDAYILKLVFT